MQKLLSGILVIIFCAGVTAQQFTIKGTVKDLQSDEALGYANIRVAETTMGTAANLEGKYELKIKGGNYILVATYIGYYSDTVVVNVSEDISDLNFRLKKTEVRLTDVVILPGENPALEIIRKAIARKKEMNSKLLNYEFEAFTKGTVRTEGEIYSRGSRVSMGSADNDSSGMKITGILENQSKGFFKKPDSYKEIIIARKQSANFPPTLNILTSGRIIQNFYEDDVRFFGTQLPGPIAENALEYYHFYLEGMSAINDQKIYKINMYPQDSQDPGFVGSIYITDSTYYLVKVDLRINKAANTGGIFDTISVVQQFADYDEIYMPVDYHLLIKVNFLGIVKFGFELNSVLYNYKINQPMDDEIFSKAIVTVLPEADKKDSLYWEKTLTIPNTDEEDLAYKRIDSVSNVPRTFWDDFSILSTRVYFTDDLAVSGPLAWYRFNRVEGSALDFTFYLDDALDQRLNSYLDLSYGFADERFKTDFYGEYLFGDYRTYGITLNAYDKLSILFGDSDNYSDLTATLIALLFKEDFRDYYYSNGFDITIEGEVAPVLGLSLGYTNHTDHSATTNTDFSIFNKDKTYRPNPPVFEGKINALTAGFTLDFRDYIENGYFRRRTSQGRSYVLFSGDVTYSNGDFISSSLDYTTYKFRSRGFIRTFRSAYLNFRLYAMYNDGAIPYQDLYSLPGNINYISKRFTFRTLTVNEILGENVVTLNLEHQFRDELFKMLNIPGLKNWEITLNLFLNIALSNVEEKTEAILPITVKEFPHPFYEIGFGLGQGIIPFQLEFAWKLNYRDGNNFRVSFNAFVF
ncbi:MAG: carboxypeptidase-like regulatory domain-containing protein [Bacteroidetes bacterium]|nr:carboxypeptidase-like regulatory domain-containing protein [Bacteroidota bacterium]